MPEIILIPHSCLKFYILENICISFKFGRFSQLKGRNYHIYELICPAINPLILCLGLKLREDKSNQLHGACRTILLLSYCCCYNIPFNQKQIQKLQHISYCTSLSSNLSSLSRTRQRALGLHSLRQSLSMAANQVQKYPGQLCRNRDTGISLMV